MLGEDHSLTHEFPEHIVRINQLIDSDPEFAADNKRYTAMDKEVRKLELRDSPIEDESMYQLKADRAELKDSLYQRIVTMG